MRILVINCGSTTLKYKLFAMDGSGGIGENSPEIRGRVCEGEVARAGDR